MVEEELLSGGKDMMLELARVMTETLNTSDQDAVQETWQLLNVIDHFSKNELSAVERMEVNSAAAELRRSVLEAQERFDEMDTDPDKETRLWMRALDLYGGNNEPNPDNVFEISGNQVII